MLRSWATRVGVLALSTALIASPTPPPASAQPEDPNFFAADSDTTWGVTDQQAAASDQIDAAVFDFEQIGDMVYVAGKFAEAAGIGPDGASRTRRGLAAFDVHTGELISSFSPDVRGGPVYALGASPDGSRLFVSGEFDSVDGVEGTAALAAIDPVTGRLDPTWRAALEPASVDRSAVGRSLEVHGPHLYVGGDFTHIRSGDSRRPIMGAGRVSIDSGLPDESFTPEIRGGGVWDLDSSPDGSRMYLAGAFTTVNGQARHHFAAVNTLDGSLVASSEVRDDPAAALPGNAPALEPSLDPVGVNYAVAATASKIFVGGGDNKLYVLDAETLARERVYSTGRPSFAPPTPLPESGAFQTLEVVGNRVYVGCSCWSYHFAPSPNADRSSLSLPPRGAWTPVRSVTAYDAVTGAHLPGVVVDLPVAADRSGPWALLVDDTGCLWVGGSSDTADIPHWPAGASGFRRLCQSVDDKVRPSTPKSLMVDSASRVGVSLRWTAVTDNTSVAGYQIFRSVDGTAGPLIGNSETPEFTDRFAIDGVTYTYVVKALDGAGNNSWRSNLLTVTAGQMEDQQRPSRPANLTLTNSAGGQISITWTASSDNLGVGGYEIRRSSNGAAASVQATVTGTSFVDRAVTPDTTYTYVVVAIDHAGNASWRSSRVVALLPRSP